MDILSNHRPWAHSAARRAAGLACNPRCGWDLEAAHRAGAVAGAPGIPLAMATDCDAQRVGIGTCASAMLGARRRTTHGCSHACSVRSGNTGQSDGSRPVRGRCHRRRHRPPPRGEPRAHGAPTAPRRGAEHPMRAVPGSSRQWGGTRRRPAHRTRGILTLLRAAPPVLVTRFPSAVLESGARHRPASEGDVDRLLLLMTTTSYKAAAFLDAARALGVDVVVGSDRPHAPCRARARAVLALPFTDAAAATRAVHTAAAAFPSPPSWRADDDGVVLAASSPSARLTAQQRDGGDHGARQARDASRPARGGAAGTAIPLRADRRRPTPPAVDLDYPCVLKPVALSRQPRRHPRQRRRGIRRRLRARVRHSVEPRRSQSRRRGAADPRGGLHPRHELALEGLLETASCGCSPSSTSRIPSKDRLPGDHLRHAFRPPPSSARGWRPRCEALWPPSDCKRGRCTPRCAARDGVYLVGSGTALDRRSLRPGAALRRRGREPGGAAAALRLRHDIAPLQREGQAAGVMMIRFPALGSCTGVDGVAAATRGPAHGRRPDHCDARAAALAAPEARATWVHLRPRPDPGAVETALRTSHARLVLDIRPPTTTSKRCPASAHRASFGRRLG